MNRGQGVSEQVSEATAIIWKKTRSAICLRSQGKRKFPEGSTGSRVPRGQARQSQGCLGRSNKQVSSVFSHFGFGDVIGSESSVQYKKNIGGEEPEPAG